VDDFIHDLYTAVKETKPWVVVGISPFGIWRSGTPAGVTGLDAYGEIYADSRRWLQEGWLDYLAPQLYWALDGVQQRFSLLDDWWHQQNTRDRYIWPGLATMNTRRGSWPASEITAQIASARTSSADANGVPGHIHFRLGSLLDSAFDAVWANTTYTRAALVPAFPWLDARKPAVPRVRDLERAPRASQPLRQLQIAAGDTVPVAWWLVQRQAENGTWESTLVRAANMDTVDVFDPTLGVPQHPWRSGPRTLFDAMFGLGAPAHPIGVRAIGRTGEMSAVAWID
jgi:hypothetical protein